MNEPAANPITYERWLGGLTAWSTRARDVDHKTSRTMQLIQDEPREMGELADLFVNLPIHVLRSAFVAIMVDAHTIDPSYSAGALARPLIVIAERLGRAKFDEEVLLDIKEHHRMHATPSDPSKSHVPSQISQPRSGGFTFERCPLPSPVRGRAPDELTLAMRTLSSDLWIRVKAKDMTWAKLQARIKRAKEIGASKLLYAFKTNDGDFAVCIAKSLEQIPARRGRGQKQTS